MREMMQLADKDNKTAIIHSISQGYRENYRHNEVRSGRYSQMESLELKKNIISKMKNTLMELTAD